MATVLMCLWASSSFAQTATSQYQPGTILKVTPHHETGATDPSVQRFDVAVQVADTVYTVLFSQPAGRIGIEHRAGLQLLVLVKDKTMRSSFLGAEVEAPIIDRQPAAQWKKQH